MKMIKIIKIIIFIILLMFAIPIKTCFSLDRCQDFIPDVRQYSIQYLGIGFPYWYNIGCMIAESSCRPDVVSFDGGIGLFQLTPSTGILKEISKYISVDPYNTKSNIRAQAFYLSRVINVHFKREQAKVYNKYDCYPNKYVENCGLNLADVYRFYNGGYWFFYEAGRSERPYSSVYVCDNEKMKEFCIRGGTWVGSGDKKRWLSFCDVNYSYPEKIFNYSQKYKNGPDFIRYWYEEEQIINTNDEDDCGCDNNEPEITNPDNEEKEDNINSEIIVNENKNDINEKPIKESFFTKILHWFKNIIPGGNE